MKFVVELFMGHWRNTRFPVKETLPGKGLLLASIAFRNALHHVKKKRRLFLGPHTAVVRLIKALPHSTVLTRFGILTKCPFSMLELCKTVQFSPVWEMIRIDSPTTHRASCGTFLLFSLQESHLYNHYSHQDLH